MIHTPNSLMMMDGAEKRAVIFLPGFQEMGHRLQNLPFLPFSRKIGTGNPGRGKRACAQTNGDGLRRSRLRLPPSPFRGKSPGSEKRIPIPVFRRPQKGSKTILRRLVRDNRAAPPSETKKHAHCKLFIIKGNGPSQSPSPPLHREAKEKGAAAGSRRPTGGFRGKWPAVFPRQPTPEVFPTSRPFPFPAKLP